MGFFLWRRRTENTGRHHRPLRQQPARGGLYWSAQTPLRPSQVRGRSFGLARFGRRGLDPVEVGEFLDRVAGDLATLYAALDRVGDENERIKDALRQWQTRQARRVYHNAGRY
ncbi:hypothetical protein CA850_06300 [Micromonospora echinospora]|uniref:DivIVA domain-containing protein n=1 Tax=Micromonospora echinospora TaxID=1877 RepID=A0A1C4V5I2_MICEC|nr:DivIVA domain-containing protein [Micromonospora echinospora]OZV83104.1 hypothetical protein CA850_06300 [Micromonospora echinospora]SCE79298.1 DivIVA domain-containing protein [Micromonospora echinospora]